MIGDADFAAQHHEISQPRAARNADLPGDHAVPADDDVVRDLHKIVDLGALADDGVAGRAAVDRDVGADFHVVLNDDAADLRDFPMALRRRQIAEPVLADAGAGMDDHAVADQRVQHRRAGADRAIAADRDARADHGAGRDQRASADLGARADHRERIDVTPASSRAEGCTCALAARPLAPNSDEGRSAAGNSARATATKARYGSAVTSTGR